MVNTEIVKETGKTTRTFFGIMKEQPLSLALVVMNFTLLGFMFYHQSGLVDSRAEMAKIILANQRETESLLAKCTPIDIESILKSLVYERIQRELGRPPSTPEPPTPKP